ncbi:MAG: polyprenol monophosphomannose synthase [Candidatus Latescibacteria bacterium]|nr:polyprenol monophosphomannose synthase [Candidatus Latescibacterota bacterium]MCK5381497.1 polyprenol monophosphomannose synthase [Candidatus Latescibacterota bacterium]MCK5525645.1 polyprenol monophosphomannose synthase [Candidatus Latescibacterota bacterium]MCK5734340.1 polyprenol monophosphomannose synthase [Candidatus Latescibacterota bacterium]
MPSSCLIVIPTYNEKENIREIVEAILKLDRNLDILIVDDNSPDGTGRIADELSGEREAVHVLHREEKSGLGAAYMAGFKYALAHQYDLIFEMDADFSHDPKYIPLFLDKIESSDLVIGSRYTDGVNVVNWPMRRLLLSYYANMYSRIVTGMPIRDATGGYKCFRRAVLEALDMDGVSSTGYAFQIEMNFRAWKKGFRIHELPIVFWDRRKGVSKMSFNIAKEAIWMVWKLRIGSFFGRI